MRSSASATASASAPPVAGRGLLAFTPASDTLVSVFAATLPAAPPP